MFYQLPHVPVSLIPSINPLPDLFPEESPTSMSESPPSITDVPSHAFDEFTTSIIGVPTDTALTVDPTGPFDSHALRRSHRVTTFLLTFVTFIAFLLSPLSRNLIIFMRLPLTLYGSKL